MLMELLPRIFLIPFLTTEQEANARGGTFAS